MNTEKICPRCGRSVLTKPDYQRWHTPVTGCPIAYVEHAGFGCDSGCCGLRFILEDAQGNDLDTAFEFIHNSLDTFVDWARERGAKIDFEQCVSLYDVDPPAADELSLLDPDVRAIYEAAGLLPLDRD